MLPVAILAGGLATRLRPLTEMIPKALVDVAGEPFISRQLRYLRGQGVNSVVLCIGYLGQMIQDRLGNGEEFGLSINYSMDGPDLLGTGGALTKAIPLLGDDFFILYGDSYLPVNFSSVQKAYESSNRRALMTILKNRNLWDRSNVMFVEGRLVEYNKYDSHSEMAYIDYGLGVMSASTLVDYSTDNPFDLADLYHDLSVHGQLAGFEVHERFYEIGSLPGLKDAEDYFLSRGQL